MAVGRPARVWGWSPRTADGGRAAGIGPGGQPAELAMHGAEIDQATGMVTEKQGVGIAEAFVRLRAHAYAHHRRLGRSGPRCHGAPRVAEPGSGRTRGLPGV